MNALQMVFGITLLGASMSACRERGPQALPPTPQSGTAMPTGDSPSAQIWISRTGTIELNGRQVDVDALGAELADLAKRKGVVLYGRDAPEEEPHPNGMKVIELVAQNRLPIRMSTKRDFSDAVGPDGKLKQ